DGLVMDGDGLDVVGALVQRVDEADIAVAAQAEDVGHLLAHQIVDDHLTAVEHVLGHRIPAWLERFSRDWRQSLRGHSGARAKAREPGIRNSRPVDMDSGSRSLPFLARTHTERTIPLSYSRPCR